MNNINNGGYDMYGDRTITIGDFTTNKVCCECGSDNFHVNISVTKNDWYFDDPGIWCNNCERGIESIINNSDYKKEEVA